MSAPADNRYAGTVSRSIAFFVDATIVVAFTIGVVAVVAVAGLIFGRPPRHLGSLLVITPPISMVCYSAAFWALAGRTPGTALLGLRVARVDGHPVSFLRALIRALMVVCLPIGFLWSIVDRRHQALHDKVAGTIVVRDLPGVAALVSVTAEDRAG